jgi:hypothetical protein
MPGGGRKLNQHILQVLVQLRRLKRFFLVAPFPVHHQRLRYNQRLRAVVPFDLDSSQMQQI